MFNITILAIGKVKESYINTAIVDYLKRLSPYGKIKIEELKAEKFNENNHEQAKVIEGERIKAYLEKRTEARVIIMDELGKMIKSVDFSQLVDGEQRPTEDDKIDIERIRTFARLIGFQEAKTFNAGQYHFGVIFMKV
jgi:23S rRNA pseudoU1915 N3-methylase RlmH